MQEKSQLETQKVARGSKSYIAIRITTECPREYEPQMLLMLRPHRDIFRNSDKHYP